jgi:isoquinoline 1-oxidoreductase beta subunit
MAVIRSLTGPLAFQWPEHASPDNEPVQPADHPDGQFTPSAFIRSDKAGKTTLVIPQAEMGQGVYTAIAMILAEELDADFAQVAITHAPPSDKLYANLLFGIQVTGNSNSIRAFWDKLREAGAAARAMLIAAAAAQWQVDAASCSASNGRVTHTLSNRTLTYGELADAASKLAVPDKPKLKEPKDFTLIGKPVKRHDTPDKTKGKTIYSIDAMVSDMKFATLAHCPVLGGKVKHVDDSAAKSLPGVRQVVVLDDLVAVIGDHMWAAWRGLE